ncbi:hypothetical protein RDI58_026532 [Solanum bulbocastanum]|uniref:Uncharacterized protein n=1 Tax=Solanum bulbocastanum TaxID=147425 RepID=A0AAN8SZ87_SOLBU
MKEVEEIDIGWIGKGILKKYFWKLCKATCLVRDLRNFLVNIAGLVVEDATRFFLL